MRALLESGMLYQLDYNIESALFQVGGDFFPGDQMSDLSAKSARVLFLDLVRAARAYLVYQEERGLAGVDRRLLQEAAGPSRQERPNPAAALRRIREDLGDCRRCPLHQGRTNLVFGEGDPFARLVFVGEGPGEDEDAQGLPFVGSAGKLLTRIIENGMKLKRSEVYISNIVKCRPPDNRDPEPSERSVCFSFLVRQLEAIRPRVIVALGKVAAQTLLETEVPISKLRGTWREWSGIPVMPTFHPSYLLRNQGAKRLVWEDVKAVMDKLGLSVEDDK